MKEHSSSKKIWRARFPKSCLRRREVLKNIVEEYFQDQRLRGKNHHWGGFSHIWNRPVPASYSAPSPTPHPLNWNKIMADSSSPPSPSICCRELWKSCQKGQKNVLSRQKMAKSWRLSFLHSCQGRPDISVYHAQTIFTASYKIFPLNLGLESVNRELRYESIKHIIICA